MRALRLLLFVCCTSAIFFGQSLHPRRNAKSQAAEPPAKRSVVLEMFDNEKMTVNAVFLVHGNADIRFRIAQYERKRVKMRI